MTRTPRYWILPAVLLAAFAFISIPETAEAGRTQNRQLFTLCTLGIPGSYGVSDCEQLWYKCATKGRKWRRRNCRIRFFPGALQQAQRLVHQATSQAASPP